MGEKITSQIIWGKKYVLRDCNFWGEMFYDFDGWGRKVAGKSREKKLRKRFTDWGKDLVNGSKFTRL